MSLYHRGKQSLLILVYDPGTSLFTFFSVLFPRGEKFSGSGPHNPFRHQIHNPGFQDIVYFWSDHNRKVCELHGVEMYDYLSELTNLSFLSCRKYQPQSGDRK